jgi:hypothetical protein
MLRIYPGGSFVGLKYLLYGTPGLVFLLEVESKFLPVYVVYNYLLLIVHKPAHWLKDCKYLIANKNKKINKKKVSSHSTSNNIPPWSLIPCTTLQEENATFRPDYINIQQCIDKAKNMLLLSGILSESPTSNFNNICETFYGGNENIHLLLNSESSVSLIPYLNSVAFFRKRTIPTERPPLSAK